MPVQIRPEKVVEEGVSKEEAIHEESGEVISGREVADHAKGPTEVPAAAEEVAAVAVAAEIVAVHPVVEIVVAEEAVETEVVVEPQGKNRNEYRRRKVGKIVPLPNFSQN
jgi:hypothetical protein